MPRNPLPCRQVLLAAGLLAACHGDEPTTGPIVDGHARFTVLTPTLIRMEYAADDVFEDHATQTVGVRAAPDVAFSTEVVDGERLVQTDGLVLHYRQDSGPFTAENVTLELLREPGAADIHPDWSTDADPDKLGGWRRSLDNRAVRQELHPGLLSRRGWSLVDDSDTVVLSDDGTTFTPRPAHQGAYQDGYFFGYGHDYRGALSDLRVLTGAPPLLPKKALGVWFSRYWSYSADEWHDLVASFHDGGVPLDVISVDTDWKQMRNAAFCDVVNSFSGARPGDPCSWNGWAWNTDLYPDPAEFLSWAHGEGLDVGLNIHPSINEVDAAYAGVQALTGPLLPDTTLPPCALVQADPGHACLVFDWTQPAQMDAYFGLHRPIAADGVDFWWLDWCCDGSSAVAPGLAADPWINAAYAREHRQMGSRWPAFSRIGGSYQGGPDGADHGLLGALAERRATLHFTGDTCATWEMLGFTAELTVDEGAVGLPYVSHDIGSFNGPREDGEVCDGSSIHAPHLPDDLYVRWVQLGTFQPLDRLHSNHGDRLPWDYTPAADAIARDFLRLRSALVPHLYTLSREAHDTGLPMARALFLQWPEEDEAYAHPTEFTLGDDLLVATVAAAGDPATVDVWIPPGLWFDLFSGERLEGPAVVSRSVPLATYPVFARAGSLLVTQPDVVTSVAGPQDALIVTTWAGADGTASLYEDEGRGFGYETGASTTTTLHAASADACHTVTVDAPKGDGFPGALATRSWEVRLVDVDAPGAVRVGAGEVPAGDTAPGWSYDADHRTVTVRTGPVDATRATTVSVGCP